jgi:hypothetical protein
MCFAACGIVAHRKTALVKIDGDRLPGERGKICAKGQAGLIGLTIRRGSKCR